MMQSQTSPTYARPMRLVYVRDMLGDVVAIYSVPEFANTGDIHIPVPAFRPARLSYLGLLPHWRTYGWDDEFPPPPPPVAGVDLGMRWREYCRRR